MKESTKLRHCEMLMSLRIQLERKYEQCTTDLKYADNIYQQEYLSSYQQFLAEEIARINVQLRDLYN